MRIIPHYMDGLWNDQRGNVLMLVGIGILVLTSAVGSAVDLSRAQLVQSKLSAALDAAGLAAGAVANSQNFESEAQRYFAANFPDGFMGTHTHSLVVTANSDRTVLTLSVEAEMDTTVMRVVGVNSVSVSTSSEITRANKGMELVMVLDTTGSMAGSKMTSLRNAATDLTNVLYGSHASLPDLWVSVVPYVTTVNIGNGHTAWLKNFSTGLYPANYPASATKWKGCIRERSGGLDVTDDPPDIAHSNTLWPPYLWPDTTVDNNWINDSNGSVSLNEGYDYSDTNGRGPNIGCGQPILPFTSQKSTVLSHIASLQHWRRGGTMSNVGLVWGWRVISPRWRGLWAHEDASLPLSYDTPLMEKVVVLMTDGENQFFDQSSADPPYSDYTAYGRLDDLVVGTTNQTTARDVINARTLQICTAMKQQGILIYTVTFQLGNSTAQQQARALFRSCATSPSHYFDAESQVPNAPPSPSLQTAFRAIGDSLANLRVSH